MALEPDNAIVLSGYAHMLLTLGSREQALQLFRKAVVSDPLAVNAWTSLGRGLEAVGQTAEAKRCERAAEISQKWGPTFSAACCCGPGTSTRPWRCSRAWTQKPDPRAVSPWPNTHAATKWRRAMRWLRWRRVPRPALAYPDGRCSCGQHGEKDQALSMSSVQAYATHDGGMVRLPWDPAMDPAARRSPVRALVAGIWVSRNDPPEFVPIPEGTELDRHLDRVRIAGCRRFSRYPGIELE